jgi:peptidoglycan/xylan/chitin deacetylase (PgdA/CDA1 family)
MRLWLWLSSICLSLWADAHIFVYHRFGDTKHQSTNTSIEVLKKEFEYFRTNGYRVVTLSKLVKTIKEGKSVPDNWVVLTIDDSYKSFYENGLPIFKAYGYPFTLFVYTKATEAGYGDFMTWKEINEAKKYGELGFHSHRHPHMVSKSSKDLKKDFTTGIELMQKRTGVKPKYFAYPYGEYDNRVKKIAKEYNFEAIVNQNVGAVSKFSDIFDIDRIALTGSTNLKSKLKIKFLPATWIEPKNYPEDGILKSIQIKIDTPVKTKKAQLYITGYGWQWVPIKNNIVKIKLRKLLKNRRSRLILKLDNDKISTKILVKP